MQRRTAWAIIGALAQVCVGLVLSVAYPFSTGDPHGASPVDERFTAEPPDEFAITASIDIDGTTTYALEAVVLENGERYAVYETDHARIETYQSSPGSDAYDRLEVDEAGQPDLRIDNVDGDDDQELLRVDRSEGGATIVAVEPNASGVADSIAGSAALYTRSLHVATYDRVDQRNGMDVYRPQGGWFDEADTYRIGDAFGTVVVDPETNVVQSASVSWELTRSVETYAEYRLVSLVDESEKHTITYELETDPDAIDAPDWVADARSDR